MFMHSRSHEPQNTKETSRAREHPKVKVPARSSSWARCACDATLRDSQLFSHSDSHIKYTQKGGTRSTLIHSQPFERCSPLHALCVARQSCMLGCRAGPRPHPNSTRPRAGTCFPAALRAATHLVVLLTIVTIVNIAASHLLQVLCRKSPCHSKMMFRLHCQLCVCRTAASATRV